MLGKEGCREGGAERVLCCLSTVATSPGSASTTATAGGRAAATACRAGWSPEERSESAEIHSAPALVPAPHRPALGSARCAGAARLLCGPIAARPAGRLLSGAPAAAARFFNVHRQ